MRLARREDQYANCGGRSAARLQTRGLVVLVLRSQDLNDSIMVGQNRFRIALQCLKSRYLGGPSSCTRFSAANMADSIPSSSRFSLKVNLAGRAGLAALIASTLPANILAALGQTVWVRASRSFFFSK